MRVGWPRFAVTFFTDRFFGVALIGSPLVNEFVPSNPKPLARLPKSLHLTDRHVVGTDRHPVQFNGPPRLFNAYFEPIGRR